MNWLVGESLQLYTERGKSRYFWALAGSSEVRAAISLVSCSPMADEELPRAAVVANEEWNAPAGGWDMSMVGKDGRSLAERLEVQRSRGSRYLVGSSLTAVDVYWAVFAAMIEPLPAAKCPMPDVLRTQYTLTDPAVARAAAPSLLEHRDFVYESHLELPIDL